MPTTHPTAADLHAFLLGKLPESGSTEVEAHLADCPECLHRAAADTPTDTLVDLLAAANTRLDRDRVALSTPALDADTQTLIGLGPVPAGTHTPPTELADHPKYRVTAPLGSGGMGTVWLAEHLVMGRTVAVKVIRPEWADRQGAVERFRNEVRAVARLAHEHIATAHDAEHVGDRLVLVMEYVPGESLAGVARRGPLPVAEACRAARDAARGLAHAHAAGVIHRDVKPSNLVRTPAGVTKVLDFGLASAGWDEPALSGAGLLMGTPDYIAPEQANDPHAADPRSDIYALGCTLYHLLAGRVPYPLETVMRKVDAHRDPAVQPSPLPVSAAVAGVVAKMMSKNPADRYQSAADVADALEPFCQPSPVASPAGSDSPRRADRPRFRWLIAAGLLFAFVAVAALVVHRIQTDKGELVVETTDDDVEVVVKQGGKLVTVYDPKSKQKLVLQSGTYEFELNGKPTGLKLDIDKATLKRGDTVLAKISRTDTAGAKEVKPANADVPTAHRPHRVFTGHTAYVWNVAFSPDAKTVYSCGADGYVRIWDVESGRETAKCRHDHPVFQLALAEGEGTLLAVTNPEKPGEPPSRLYAWDAVTGKEAKAFPATPAAEGRLSDVTVSPNGKRAATLTHSGVVRVWDVAGRKTVQTWKTGFDELYSYQVVWSPDGERLVVIGGAPLSVWEASTGKRVHSDEKEHGDTSAAFSPNGKTLFVSGWSGITRRYDTTTWKEERPLSTHESRGPAAAHLAALGDDRLVITSHTADVRIWDVWADKLITRLRDDGLDSTLSAVSSDGKRIVCGGSDGKIRVWDLPDTKPAQAKPAEK